MMALYKSRWEYRGRGFGGFVALAFCIIVLMCVAAAVGALLGTFAAAAYGVFTLLVGG